VIALVFAALTVAPRSEADPLVVDRAVVRFAAREIGGTAAPRFVFERELAFEARLEALAEGDVGDDEPAFRERHVRAALERHVTETVLEGLGVTPAPTLTEISGRIEQARLALVERVGGLVPLMQAARAEGLGDSEVQRLFRREALASLYLDRVIAPMLDPSEAELRALHRTERTPFSGRPYDEIAGSLRRWYVSGRLGAALSSFYDGLRGRLSLTVLR
jgi:hypothetical protein